MEQRSSKRKNGPVLQAIRHSVRFFRNYKQWNNRTFIVVLLASVAVSMMLTLLVEGARGISLTSSDSTVVHHKSKCCAEKVKFSGEECRVGTGNKCAHYGKWGFALSYSDL